MTLLLWLCIVLQEQHWDDKFIVNYEPKIVLDEVVSLVEIYGVKERPYYSKCVRWAF